MKVGIVIADSNSACPVPAVKGGAVATLVEHLVEMNNLSSTCEMTVISYYDKKAEAVSKKYKNIHFQWIKIPGIIIALDKFVSTIVLTLFPKKKAISFKHVVSLLYYINSASRYIKNTQMDEIVLENNVLLFWCIKLRKNYEKYKYKYSIHLHNIPRINPKCQKVIENTGKIICVSEYVANTIIEKKSSLGKIDKDRIRIVKNCINVNQYNDEMLDYTKLLSYKKKYGINDNDLVLVYAGRLSKEKGVDHAILTLKYLPQNTKLLIVGATLVAGNIKSEYSDYLETISDDFQKQIIYTGYIKQSDMQYIYSLAKFAILPSMWEEPAGLTMIEAMACGTVVITTKSGGIPEYTTEGASIVLEKNDDNLSENIAKEVIRINGNEELYKTISLKGKMYVRNNFNYEHYIDRFINALKE